MVDTVYYNETNNLQDTGISHSDKRVDVFLDDERLSKITRLRLLTDPGFPYWDISYCYGELKDGTLARVKFPVHQLRKRDLKRHIVQVCIESGVHGKKLGLLDDSNISKLW